MSTKDEWRASNDEATNRARDASEKDAFFATNPKNNTLDKESNLSISNGHTRNLDSRGINEYDETTRTLHNKSIDHPFSSVSDKEVISRTTTNPKKVSSFPLSSLLGQSWSIELKESESMDPLFQLMGLSLNSHKVYDSQIISNQPQVLEFHIDNTTGKKVFKITRENDKSKTSLRGTIYPLDDVTRFFSESDGKICETNARFDDNTNTLILESLFEGYLLRDERTFNVLTGVVTEILCVRQNRDENKEASARRLWSRREQIKSIEPIKQTDDGLIHSTTTTATSQTSTPTTQKSIPSSVPSLLGEEITSSSPENSKPSIGIDITNPPTTFGKLAHTWRVEIDQSESMEPALLVMGMGWALRKLITSQLIPKQRQIVEFEPNANGQYVLKITQIIDGMAARPNATSVYPLDGVSRPMVGADGKSHQASARFDESTNTVIIESVHELYLSRDERKFNSSTGFMSQVMSVRKKADPNDSAIVRRNWVRVDGVKEIEKLVSSSKKLKKHELHFACALEPFEIKSAALILLCLALSSFARSLYFDFSIFMFASLAAYFDVLGLTQRTMSSTSEEEILDNIHPLRSAFGWIAHFVGFVFALRMSWRDESFSWIDLFLLCLAFSTVHAWLLLKSNEVRLYKSENSTPDEKSVEFPFFELISAAGVLTVFLYYLNNPWRAPILALTFAQIKFVRDNLVASDRRIATSPLLETNLTNFHEEDVPSPDLDNLFVRRINVFSSEEIINRSTDKPFIVYGFQVQTASTSVASEDEGEDQQGETLATHVVWHRFSHARRFLSNLPHKRASRSFPRRYWKDHLNPQEITKRQIDLNDFCTTVVMELIRDRPIESLSRDLRQFFDLGNALDSSRRRRIGKTLENAFETVVQSDDDSKASHLKWKFLEETNGAFLYFYQDASSIGYKRVQSLPRDKAQVIETATKQGNVEVCQKFWSRLMKEWDVRRVASRFLQFQVEKSAENPTRDVENCPCSVFFPNPSVERDWVEDTIRTAVTSWALPDRLTNLHGKRREAITVSGVRTLKVPDGFVWVEGTLDSFVESQWIQPSSSLSLKRYAERFDHAVHGVIYKRAHRDEARRVDVKIVSNDYFPSWSLSFVRAHPILAWKLKIV